MRVDKIGVHVTHCCIVHGCKYRDEDCPVVAGLLIQKYLCEDCDDFYEKNRYDMNKIEKVFLKKNRKLKLKRIEKISVKQLK